MLKQNKKPYWAEKLSIIVLYYMLEIKSNMDLLFFLDPTGYLSNYPGRGYIKNEQLPGRNTRG